MAARRNSGTVTASAATTTAPHAPSWATAGITCRDQGPAQLDEHVLEGLLGLGPVPGLGGAAVIDVSRVVAVAGVPADDQGVDQEREWDGALDGALDPVAGLAGAQDVAGISERLLDSPPAGVAGHQRAGGSAQVGGDQGQVIAAGGVLVAGQDQPHGAGVPGPVPQAADLGDVPDLLPAVGGDGHRVPGGGGGYVTGGAEPVPFGAGPAAAAGARRRQVIQHRVAGDPAGPGHVAGQGAQRRAVVGGVGHDVHRPVREGQCELADQGGGGLHLAVSVPLAGQVQPGQHRQAHRPGAERQPDHDPGGDKAVAVAELAQARGAAVVLPAGAVYLATAAAEHRIIDRDLQVSAGRHHAHHRDE